MQSSPQPSTKTSLKPKTTTVSVSSRPLTGRCVVFFQHVCKMIKVCIENFPLISYFICVYFKRVTFILLFQWYPTESIYFWSYGSMTYNFSLLSIMCSKICLLFPWYVLGSAFVVHFEQVQVSSRTGFGEFFWISSKNYFKKNEIMVPHNYSRTATDYAQYK